MRIESAVSIGVSWALLCAGLCGCADINVVKKQKLELKPTSTPLRSFAFPSGLRVIIERDTRTPLAGVFLVVGSGSSSDPAGKEGLAHYVEHLAFQSRPFGQENFWNLQDQVGVIERNASTGFDATTYYQVGPAAALPQMLRTEAIRMVVPVSDVPDTARAIELDVVQNELRERNETGFIGDVLGHMLAAMLPANHPYARPTGGSHESVATFTKADVDAFAKAHYRPDNMTLVLVGNVELERADELLAGALPGALVETKSPVKLPERLSAQPPPVPAPPPAPARLPRVEAAISSPELWIGWVLPRGFDRDGYLLSFLAGAMGSRFSQVAQDDRDIAAVQVFPQPGKEASMVFCRVALHEAVDPEKTLARLLTEAPKVVDGFSQSVETGDSRFTFSEMLYSRARRTLLVGELLETQDLTRRGTRRATVTHFSQDPALLSKALGDLAQLKPEKFRDYGKPYLTAERARAILFVAPAGAAASGVVRPFGDRSSVKVAAPTKELADALLASPAPFTQQKLKNGITVVLVRRPGLPLFTATLALGVVAEKSGGAALAFARAMARPETDFNDPSEYGGHVAQRIDASSLVTTVEGSSGNAEAVLATLAENVRTLHVQRGDDIRFKEYVLPSYRRSERDPHLLAERSFFDALLPGNAYARVPAYEELDQATVGAAQAWLAAAVGPANATLVLAGDFEDAPVLQFANESFGNWKPQATATAVAAPAPDAVPTSTEVKVLTTPRPGASQGELRFGCRLAPETSGAIAARHELAAHVAQDRLWFLLREKLGASYGAHVSVEARPGVAWLDVRANVENGKLGAVVTELHKALEQLAAAPPSADAVGWARYEAAARVALLQTTNESAAGFVAFRALRGLSTDLADVRRELGAVTGAELQEEFKTCLAGRPALSIIGEAAVVSAVVKDGWR